MTRAIQLTRAERIRAVNGGIARWADFGMGGMTNEERGEELYARLKAGESVTRMSADFNVSHQRIYQLVDKYKAAVGLPPNEYRRYGHEVFRGEAIRTRAALTLEKLPIDIVEALAGREWSLAHEPTSRSQLHMPCKRHFWIDGQYYCVHLRTGRPSGGPVVYPKHDEAHHYWHLNVQLCLKVPEVDFVVFHVPRAAGPATFVIPRAGLDRRTVSIIGIDRINRWGRRNRWEKYRDAWPWTPQGARVRKLLAG